MIVKTTSGKIFKEEDQAVRLSMSDNTKEG